MKAAIVHFFLLPLLLFSVSVCEADVKVQTESTPQVVDFLISAVAESHLTFIRNGEKHTSEEAAEHIQMKYDYFRDRIKTPEDFIGLCASKSILSGKQYLVITDNGTIPVSTWLEQELANHEKSQKRS